MIIYKITNIINNKIYIGQTINTLEERWKRHQNDALSNRLDTHFAKAIRKYGIDNFTAEVIDTAQSQDELTAKETYWIHYYDSIQNGYNETDAEYKSGGNTYLSKTDEELDIIKEKIRQTKLGNKNPNTRKVKCRNVDTNEEIHFDTIAEVQQYFNHDNHNFVTRRCNHTIRCLWQGKWQIAYEEDDYDALMTREKNNRKSTHINVEVLDTGNIYSFPSYASAERFFDLPQKSISSKAYLKGETFVFQDKYKITVLN